MIVYVIHKGHTGYWNGNGWSANLNDDQIIEYRTKGDAEDDRGMFSTGGTIIARHARVRSSVYNDHDNYRDVYGYAAR